MASMRRRQQEGGESNEESEDEAEKRQRQRQMEKEADMKNAEDLFGGMGISKNNRSGPKAVTLTDPSDLTKAVDLSKLKMFSPSNRDEFVQLRDILAPLLTANEKKAQYTTFVQDFTKQIAKDLSSDQIKKVVSTLTSLSNEKLREEKAAEKGGKKSKAAKTKSSLNASRDALRADTNAYDDDGLDE